MVNTAGMKALCRFVFCISPSERHRLRRIALDRGVSAAALAREAVRDLLDQPDARKVARSLPRSLSLDRRLEHP